MILSLVFSDNRTGRGRLYAATATLACVSMAGVSGLANAAPTVDGQTILLPDDGWYQVQSREDYRQICAGVRSCEVEAGSYIVINHTTGQRFEQVTVGQGAIDGNQLVVSANSISWPDDGWYQVQSADDYASLCQGGGGCAVPAGEYIVINHTTGQRWEDVLVSGDEGSEGSDLQAIDLRYQRYSVSAIELFWSRQPGAQSPIEYTVFQNGSAMGSTTGVSFFIEGLSDDQDHEFVVKPFDDAEGISITVPAPVDTGVPGGEDRVLSLANAQQILAGVVSVINEEAIDALYEDAAEDLNFQGKTFFISNTVEDIAFVGGGDVEPPRPLENQYGEGDFHDAIRYSEYACASGGGLKVYFAYEINASDTVFDNCVAGSNSYSGTTGTRNIQRGSINRFPVYDFTVTDSSGATRSLSGGYADGNRAFIGINAETRWDSADYRGPLEGGQLQISDYSIVHTRVDTNSGIGNITLPGDDGELVRVVEYRVENSVSGRFAVSAPWSHEQQLQVSVDLSFNDDALIAKDPETDEAVPYSRTDPEESFYWQAGSIEVSAADGSRLLVTLVEGERDSFLISTGEGEALGPLLWDEGYTINP